MKLIHKSTNRQLRGLALATMAWVLCSTSVDHPEWRVWHFQGPDVSKSNTAFVGMWRMCIYPYANNSDNVGVCHRYSYHNTFIPTDIRVSQHLMLVSSLLSLIGTVTITVSVWNMYTRKQQKKVFCNPFCFIGILNIIVSSFVSLSFLLNYVSIKRQVGIAFPPSFHVPSLLYTQEIGSAMVAAGVAAFLFLSSGIIFISFNFSLDTYVYCRV
ncbi:claudin-34-like [Nannospalax galili]|uniref:claudin-34-like n=1 Tax=Nannospalax galili TaxID=1026970 RepID=UPI0004ED384D|nr:claudin-34-like [Nannospalax galili]